MALIFVTTYAILVTLLFVQAEYWRRQAIRTAKEALQGWREANQRLNNPSPSLVSFDLVELEEPYVKH